MTRDFPPSIDSLFYRFDPAVLFIELMLPEYASGIADIIYANFQQWYRGNDSAVRRLLYISTFEF